MSVLSIIEWVIWGVVLACGLWFAIGIRTAAVRHAPPPLWPTLIMSFSLVFLPLIFLFLSFSKFHILWILFILWPLSFMAGFGYIPLVSQLLIWPAYIYISILIMGTGVSFSSPSKRSPWTARDGAIPLRYLVKGWFDIFSRKLSSEEKEHISKLMESRGTMTEQKNSTEDLILNKNHLYKYLLKNNPFFNDSLVRANHLEKEEKHKKAGIVATNCLNLSVAFLSKLLFEHIAEGDTGTIKSFRSFRDNIDKLTPQSIYEMFKVLACWSLSCFLSIREQETMENFGGICSSSFDEFKEQIFFALGFSKSDEATYEYFYKTSSKISNQDMLWEKTLDKCNSEVYCLLLKKGYGLSTEKPMPISFSTLLTRELNTFLRKFVEDDLNELSYLCGNCWAELQAPKRLAGKIQNCASCGKETLVPSEQIVVVAELFSQFYKKMLETYKEIFKAANKPLKKTAELEIGIYLLHRLRLFVHKQQKEDVWRCIYSSCVYLILPVRNKHIYNVVESRIYAYDKTIESKNASEYPKAWCSILLSCLIRATDDYFKMSPETPVLKSIHTSLFLNAFAFVELESMTRFNCIFLKVLSSDITSLTTDEILSQIKKGIEEADSSEAKS
jgi:hypothetical protein